MDKEALKKELEATRKKLAALQVLAGEDEEETPKVEDTEEKEEKLPEDEPETPEGLDDDEGDVRTAAQSVVASLDEIAGILEGQNDPELLKLAYEIDMVSDVIEGKKEASVLQSDKDEPYMKDNFQAGVKQSDKDEKYMDEFNTDTSSELQEKTEKNQLGKQASELPYQKIS